MKQEPTTGSSGRTRNPAIHTHCRSLLGEGPIWDWRNGRLLWVDAENHGFYCSESGDPDRTSWHEAGRFVSSIALIGAEGEALLFTTERGLAAVARPGERLSFGPSRVHAISVDYDTQALRMNDSVADPLGRLWVGTMSWDGSAPVGTLYCYDSPERFSRRRERMTIPNGMGFSPEGEWFYLTDSGAGAIYRYPFSPGSAAYSEGQRLSEEGAFVSTPAEEGVPDGLAVAADGSIFSALWGGGRVVQHDSLGRRIGAIRVPAKQPSSCAIGGPDLDTLYITSARTDINEEEVAESDGDIFMLSGVSAGREEQPLSEAFLVLLEE